MIFLDTNVLVYASTEQDARKRSIAELLIDESIRNGNGAISFQVLREFANVMFKKFGLAADEVRRTLSIFGDLPRVPESEALLDRGMEIKERYGIQFYDALIVASAEAAGCDTIYSEDMADGAVYGSVHVVDPFKHCPGKHPSVPATPRSRTRRSKK